MQNYTNKTFAKVNDSEDNDDLSIINTKVPDSSFTNKHPFEKLLGVKRTSSQAMQELVGVQIEDKAEEV
jgi:hypothetical protein